MNYRILILALIIFGCKSNREKPPTLELNEPIFIECDSISKKAVIDYKNGIREYDILGTVEMTEFEQFYWKGTPGHDAFAWSINNLTSEKIWPDSLGSCGAGLRQVLGTVPPSETARHRATKLF